MIFTAAVGGPTSIGEHPRASYSSGLTRASNNAGVKEP
jgi:hypothetical protein